MRVGMLVLMAVCFIMGCGSKSADAQTGVASTLQGEWAGSNMDQIMVSMMMLGENNFGTRQYGKPVAYIRVRENKFQLVEGVGGGKIDNRIFTFTASAQNITLKDDFGDKIVLRYVLQNQGGNAVLRIKGADNKEKVFVRVVDYNKLLAAAKAREEKAQAEERERQEKVEADRQAAERKRAEIAKIKEESAFSFTDSRDGHKYNAVKIGNATWMAENLRHRPKVGKFACYENDSAKCMKYGRLYDWNTARSVCPSGWHLPNKEEWEALEDIAGSVYERGKNLKSSEGWKDGNGVDLFGFSALPGGKRYYDDGSFFGAGYYGNWWTATEYSDGKAFYEYLAYNDDRIYWGNNVGKDDGFSVRCVQN